MKKIYVTATRHNDGKTLLTLGLTTYLARRVGEIGFIKPLGLRDLKSGTYRIDQDTLLIEKSCRVHCNIQDMNPVTVSWEFTKEYLKQEKRASLMAEVLKSYERISGGKDLVVVEGTGHAAMGAILGLSNARVASELGAKVLLVSSGGIGHPIEEVVLNKAMFDRYDVEVIGVVMNKVYPHERDLLATTGRQILQDLGVPLLGLVPYDPALSKPTVMQVLEGCRGELLCGDGGLARKVDHIQVGAMGAASAVEWISRLEGSVLVVTPGDRADIILPLLALHFAPGKGGPRLGGLVLTGGIRPAPSVLRMLKQSELPVILVREDSYATASRLHDMPVKITPDDWEKIERITRLVEDHVECDRILELL